MNRQQKRPLKMVTARCQATVSTAVNKLVLLEAGSPSARHRTAVLVPRRRLSPMQWLETTACRALQGLVLKTQLE